MKTANNQSEEKNHINKIRLPEVDIVKGASNTDQIDAMQANTTQGEGGTANILEVNNGQGNQTANGTDDEQNLENPATRGI